MQETRAAAGWITWHELRNAAVTAVRVVTEQEEVLAATLDSVTQLEKIVEMHSKVVPEQKN